MIGWKPGFQVCDELKHSPLAGLHIIKQNEQLQQQQQGNVDMIQNCNL
jgi:hypothetical protein